MHTHNDMVLRFGGDIVEGNKIGVFVAGLARVPQNVIRHKGADIGHVFSTCLTKEGHAAVASINALMRPASFSPGAVSTPDATSTWRAPVWAMARATLSAVSPPANIQGTAQRRPATRDQSKAKALPPGRSAPLGGFVST